MPRKTKKVKPSNENFCYFYVKSNTNYHFLVDEM